MQHEKREKRIKRKKEDANKLNKKHHQGGMKKEKEINKDELHKK